MSVVTFSNKDKRETGQTLSVAAISTVMAIEHNYKILILSTDFDDKSMENSFFKNNKTASSINSIFQNKAATTDVSNGLEGLVRLFASNRADSSLITSYARPILNGRLDLIASPKTTTYTEYENISDYFSQIIEVANTIYDIVMVDLSDVIPEENINRVYNVSTMVAMGLSQNKSSIDSFLKLKQANEFYQKNSIMLTIGKYNEDSEFTSKNIARYLGEGINPFVVPYSIRFADSCSKGEIVDYILKVRELTFTDGEDGKFYQKVKETAERIDYERRAIDFGIN